MRAMITAAALAVVATGVATAQTNESPAQGVQKVVKVLSVNAKPYDGSPFMSGLQAQGAAEVVVTIQNLSPHIITAWAWSVEGRYADGSVLAHSGMVDRISDLLGPDMSIALQPGTTHTFDDSNMPAGPHGDPPISLSAKIVMVALSDQTAYGDRDQIASLESMRKTIAAHTKEQLDAVDAVRKGPGAKDRIKAMIAEHEARHQGLGFTQILMLADRGDNASADFLYAWERKYQDLVLQHSVLTEVR